MLAFRTMNKSRIFIAIHYMEIGGAEISLVGLLQALDYSRYDVDLFVYSHRGYLMQFIPKEVRLLPEIPAYSYIEKPMTMTLLHGHIGVLLARLRAKWQYGQYARRTKPKDSSGIFQYVDNAVCRVLPSLRHLGTYDLAISFVAPHRIVLDKVEASHKVCWIHTDYTVIDVNVALELPVWSGYDHIVSISPDVTRTFLQVFPSLADRIVEIENILSPQFVRRRADEFDALDELHNWGVILLSIGRFTEAKNYDNVPDICRRLAANLSTHTSHHPLRWFIIGYGGDEALIRQKIKEAGMQEYVVLLGKRTNPYPYIKACDIYVQPSRYEGKSVTVREAQMLCKPVVVTNYPTASSQIQDGVDGKIVPLNNEGCARGLAEFICNTELQQRIVEYLREHDYGNEGEVRKIDKLL